MSVLSQLPLGVVYSATFAVGFIGGMIAALAMHVV